MSASTIIAKTFKGDLVDQTGIVDVNQLNAFTVDTQQLIVPDVPNGGCAFVTDGVTDVQYLSNEFEYKLIGDTAYVSFCANVVWQTTTGDLFIDLPVELISGRTFASSLANQRIPCIGAVDLSTVSNAEVFVEALAGESQLRVRKYTSLGLTPVAVPSDTGAGNTITFAGILRFD
jgi:hypothetical protein